MLTVDPTVADDASESKRWDRMTAEAVRRRVSVLLLVALTLTGRSLTAQEESIYLEYRAGLGCPSRAEFEEQVRARTAKARFVDEPEGVRRFLVEAHPEHGRVVGRLTSGRDEQTGRPREVTSADCASVVEALALMTALAVDPHAVTTATAPSATQAPTASMPPSSEPSSAPPKPVAQRPAPAARRLSRAEPVPARAEEPSWGSLLAGVRAGGVLWLDPTVVPLGILSASLEWQAEGARLWAPSVRLSAHLGASPTVHPESGAAKFRLVSGALDVCPLRVTLAPSTSIGPCLGLEGGSISARGIDKAPITYPEEASRRWWAVHQSLRLELGIGRGSRVELEAHAVEPLFAYEFVFRTPDVTILRIPWVAPSASFGLSFQFL